MAKKKFTPIVISSQDQLDRIADRLNNTTDDLGKSVRRVLSPTNEDILEDYISDLGISLCDTGTAKILSAAKDGITTWPQYFEKHWNDNDSILSWFEDNADGLVGKCVNTEYYDESGWGSTSYETFAKFRKANPGLKFVDFPKFNKVKKTSKKKSKKAKR